MVFARFTARSSVIVMALAITVAGCARNESSTTTTDSITDTTSQAMTPAPPTDAEIAAIVVNYNNVEISLGKAAQTKGSAKVKEFGERMVTDHTGVNKQATDLATRLALAPVESDASRKLTADGTAFEQSVASMTGADFDRAYIANEVALHQAVLDMLDTTLIPAAQNPDLKALLEATRPAVAAHLEHAKTVQTGLTSTSQTTGH